MLTVTTNLGTLPTTTNTNTRDINQLSDDLLLNIFSHIEDRATLSNVVLVSKRWKDLGLAHLRTRYLQLGNPSEIFKDSPDLKILEEFFKTYDKELKGKSISEIFTQHLQFNRKIRKHLQQNPSITNSPSFQHNASFEKFSDSKSYYGIIAEINQQKSSILLNERKTTILNEIERQPEPNYQPYSDEYQQADADQKRLIRETHEELFYEYAKFAAMRLAFINCTEMNTHLTALKRIIRINEVTSRDQHHLRGQIMDTLTDANRISQEPGFWNLIPNLQPLLDDKIDFELLQEPRSEYNLLIISFLAFKVVEASYSKEELLQFRTGVISSAQDMMFFKVSLSLHLLCCERFDEALDWIKFYISRHQFNFGPRFLNNDTSEKLFNERNLDASLYVFANKLCAYLPNQIPKVLATAERTWDSSTDDPSNLNALKKLCFDIYHLCHMVSNSKKNSDVWVINFTNYKNQVLQFIKNNPKLKDSIPVILDNMSSMPPWPGVKFYAKRFLTYIELMTELYGQANCIDFIKKSVERVEPHLAFFSELNILNDEKSKEQIATYMILRILHKMPTYVRKGAPNINYNFDNVLQTFDHLLLCVTDPTSIQQVTNSLCRYLTSYMHLGREDHPLLTALEKGTQHNSPCKWISWTFEHADQNSKNELEKMYPHIRNIEALLQKREAR